MPRFASSNAAERPQAPHHRHEQRGAVDHGGVDDLALAGAARLDDPADDAEREEHPAAAEVADHVERRGRLVAGPTEVRERAGERDVVDVVARGVRHRAVLAPPGHPSVDEARVAGEAGVGTDAEPLGDARPEPLEERVGRLDEPQHGLDALGCFRSTPTERRLRSRTGTPPGSKPCSTDSTRWMRRTSAPRSASIIAGERARPDPDELHHLHRGQRPSHGAPS